ncbi:MAG: hypothetical protein VYE22_12715 [Myxococcota bacterium]|nr:hypothetical protein [Myxococcota bacterium]
MRRLWLIMALAALGACGGEDTTADPPEEAPTAEVAEPEAEAEPEATAPSPEEVPLPEDFEEEAARDITAENLEDELAAMEAELESPQ